MDKSSEKKKVKKSTTDKHVGDVDEIFSDLKSGKRKKSIDEPISKTVSEHVEIDTENKQKKKRKSNDGDHPTNEEEHSIVQRRRTRSLSNADEEYPVGITAEEFMKEHQITIKGTADHGSGNYICPPPMTSFALTPYQPAIKKG